MFKPTPPKPTGPMTLDELLAHPGLRLVLEEAVRRGQDKENKIAQDRLWRWIQIHGSDKGFYEQDRVG